MEESFTQKRKHTHKKSLTLWLVAFLLMIQNTNCIQTQISMDNYEVQAKNVIYTFQMSLQNSYDKVGKLIVRFPSDFETAFNTITCAAINNLAFSGNLPCTYNPTVRMLTLDQGFPLKGKNIAFSVSGVSNPSSATQSGIFQVSSYQLTNGVWLNIETESDALTITTKPGSLQNESLTLPEGTMAGHYSTLTLKATVQHSVPKSGRIQVIFPKWNPFAGTSQQFESFVSASTSPGQVRCTAISGISLSIPSNLRCQFTQNPDPKNPSYDLLEILFSESFLQSDITAGSTIVFSVEQVRGPPSTSAQAGFSFKTLSSNMNVIDQSDVTKSISLSVKNTLVGSSAQVSVTADNLSINVKTNLNLEIRTTNPLPPNSNISITIPADFEISGINQVTGNGSLRSQITNFVLDQSQRVLHLTNVNDNYIPSFVFIYISFGTVINPAQTVPSSTFIIEMKNQAGGGICRIDQGIFFTAKAGTLKDVSIVSDEYMINELDTTYTFKIIPDDSFSNQAILKLTLPDQIKIANGIQLTSISTMTLLANVQVQFNKYIYITNGFPQGYDAKLKQQIAFSLKGFTNPPTISTTDPFELAIFYEENVNEVSRYNGFDLTFTAIPSPLIGISVDLSSQDLCGNCTGYSNTRFLVSGETVAGRPIQIGSFIRLFIPADFKIPDWDRAASSCTVVSGFSDEITCAFEQNDPNLGYIIKIDGGFDSKTSMGGKFSFFMQEIQNPFTTLETDNFKMDIYDEKEGLQYTYQGNYKKKASPSQFSYAFAESSSAVVGASSVYQLTLTLSVDTPAGAQVQVTLPEELQFDLIQTFYCSATTNISSGMLSCLQLDAYNAIITLNQNTLGSQVARNGTTITIDIGKINNPSSQKRTSSFQISSFVTLQNGQVAQINEVQTGVTVNSPNLGLVTIYDVQQTDLIELNQPTAIQISFQTQNIIPVGAQLQVTLSNNFIFGDTFEVKLNNVEVPVTVNKIAFSLTMNFTSGVRRLLQTSTGSQDFVLSITKGLINPSKGPFRYNYYNILFSTADGFYGIDGVLDKKEWIFQDCIGNCDVCTQTLDFCTSCGLDRKTGKISYFFENNQCVSTCKTGFFGNGAYQCQACEFPCTECSLGANLCTLCDKQYEKPLANPLTLSCYDACPDGTFEDKEKRQCLPCQDPCFTCTGPTQCLSCDRTSQTNRLINFFDSQQTCYETCPAISVPTPSKQCLACTNNCKTCEDLTDKCLSCNSDFFLFKTSCVKICPFGSTPSNDVNECVINGKLQIPLPFTIITAIISIGIGISSFLKGADKQGRMQQGTAFFVTTLAIVDILLRANWITLIIYLYIGKQKITAGLYLLLLGVSVILNLKMWRRMFHSKYKYEEKDKMYSMYYQNYPGTAKFIQNLSYFVSFQAIRLTYSRILGKKQFMARFTSRRRFYRLIGRLTIIEILILYIPSITMNIVNLFYVKRGSQLFYFNIDSLILVGYALILIIVVMTQREKLLDNSKLFDWRDLFARGDLQEDQEPESSYYGGGFDVSGKFVDEQIEVHSAMDYEDKTKLDMYQLEWQFNSERNVDKEQVSPAKERRDNVRPVSVFDYNEYRKLEDKRDRIVLKKDLYERKKENDLQKNGILSKEIAEANDVKRSLADQIDNLHNKLLRIQDLIIETDRQRLREVKKAEQMKRQQIVHKQGFEVPSLKSAADRSMRKKKDKVQDGKKPDAIQASLPTNIHISGYNDSPNARQNERLSEELTETEAGKPFMSSAEMTLNNGNDTYRVYTGNFRQSLETNSNALVSEQRDEDDADEENQTIEQTEEISLEHAAIASNEEGPVDQHPVPKEVEANMTLKSQRLNQGGSFGQKKV